MADEKKPPALRRVVGRNDTTGQPIYLDKDGRFVTGAGQAAQGILITGTTAAQQPIMNFAHTGPPHDETVTKVIVIGKIFSADVYREATASLILCGFPKWWAMEVLNHAGVGRLIMNWKTPKRHGVFIKALESVGVLVEELPPGAQIKLGDWSIVEPE